MKNKIPENKRYTVFAIVDNTSTKDSPFRVILTSYILEPESIINRFEKQYKDTEIKILHTGYIINELKEIADKIIKKALETTSNGNYCIELENYNLKTEDILSIKEYIESDNRISDIKLHNGVLDINCYLDYCINLDLDTDELENNEEEEKSMKIKIGNFNFISDGPNEIREELSNRLDYFYLDGKEDTLFIGSSYKFDNAKKEEFMNIEEFNFERDLLKKYRVVNYHKEIKNQINNFIQEKSIEKFINKNYSRYDLYNDISIHDILLLNNNKEYSFGYGSTITKDIQNNRIKINEFMYNPYNEKIDNLEEMYKKGKFNAQIKSNLILLEIEHNQAPEFINTILKVDEFCNGKQTINALLKDEDKVKINSDMRNLLNLSNNNISLSFSVRYEYEKLFDKEKVNLEDLRGISYGKNILEINPQTLLNLKEQIAINIDDKFRFKLDEIKESIDDEFREYIYKYEKDTNKRDVPYQLEVALDKIVKIEFNNNIIKEKIENNTYIEEKDGVLQDMPEWYSKKLEEIFEKNDLYKSLVQTDDINEAIEIAKELNDNELIDILKEEQENSEEEEEDEI